VGDDPTPAWTAWSSLPEPVQLEVGRLARLGVRHPNDDVADVAGAWASVLLSSAENERVEAWWTGLVATGESLFLFDPAVVSQMADRRAWRGWAEQVLAANAGTHPPMIPPRPVALAPRWSAEERHRQVVVFLPVLLGVVFALVFLAVLATR
jgi:hypothetical protein